MKSLSSEISPWFSINYRLTIAESLSKFFFDTIHYESFGKITCSVNLFQVYLGSKEGRILGLGSIVAVLYETRVRKENRRQQEGTILIYTQRNS